MNTTHTEILSCLAGISLALGVAVFGIKSSVDHIRSASLQKEQVAQLEGRSVRHGAPPVVKANVEASAKDRVVID